MPYWAVLGLRKATSHDSQAAIECFQKYLVARYPTMTNSTQLFGFFPQLIEEVSWCCQNLKDFTALHSIAVEAQEKMDISLDLNHKKTTGKGGPEFVWALAFSKRKSSWKVIPAKRVTLDRDILSF